MVSLAWGDIEQAALAVLRAAMGDQIATLERYQGDWRLDLGRESWRLPAVLLRFDGGRAAQVGIGSYEFVGRLTVLVITRTLAGEPHSRRSDGGAMALAQRVREALWHRDLGLQILPLALVEERPLRQGGERTVYSLSFQTGWIFEAT